MTLSIRLAGRFNDLFQPGSHFVSTFGCESNMFFIFSVLGPWRAFYISARGFLCEVLENFPPQLLLSHDSDFQWCFLWSGVFGTVKLSGAINSKFFRWESKPFSHPWAFARLVKESSGKLQLLIWSMVLVLVLFDPTEEDLVARLPWSLSIIPSGQIISEQIAGRKTVT